MGIPVTNTENVVQFDEIDSIPLNVTFSFLGGTHCHCSKSINLCFGWWEDSFGFSSI